MKKYRILHLTGSFNQGGTERQAIEAVRGLLSHGEFDVRLATLNAEGPLLADAEKLTGGRIPEFPFDSFFGRSFIKGANSAARFIRNECIDLVHSHDFYTNVFALAAGSLAGVAVNIASKRETFGLRTPRQESVENFAFGRADAIVANSLAVKEMLIEHGIPAEKIEVIYNSLDMDRFGKAESNGIRTELGLPDGIPLITLVANLRHDVKNVPLLLHSAKKVLSATDAHFVIAGEGPLESNLRARARELGIDRHVTFAGRTMKIPELLAASFAGVLTSNAEGFSNSIIEYMAAGKPVVATCVGGAAEAVVEGETGFLVEADDSERMAERLTFLLKDERNAAEMGARGRRIVEESFSRKRQVEALCELYRRKFSEAFV
ncbi:MAG: glycosyltransferase [Acidobacteria bacterium OLB17]|nr:MAG: glycosyltransferase [Acidobacteria bacterium OLB17]MCZ2389984.1 glycosyltransferase [Acidobacteriota bacterium]